MAKSRLLALAVCVAAGVGAGPVFACRYNVRETGFVDLGLEPYVLYIYVDNETAPEVTSGTKEVAGEVLGETNLRVQMINTETQKTHPALEFLDTNDVSYPSAVLVSPDGPKLPVSVVDPNKPFKQSLRSAFERILESPVRRRILMQTSKMYGVIFVIEGPDAAQNAAAVKAAKAAVELVASQMEMMPKPTASPPALVVMDRKSLASEEVLLWSFGIEAEDVNEPMAAVIYARGRWIGPLFKGEGINEDDLADILFVVGADCECGLDYRWLLGTMLPARWDQKLHARAVESLGFDPESPMIKMEIGSIIGRGLGRYGYYSRTPFGYEELVIEPEAESEALQIESIEDTSMTGGEPNVPAEPNTLEVTVEGVVVSEANGLEAGTALDAEQLEPVQEVNEAIVKVEPPGNSAGAHDRPREPNLAVAPAEPGSSPAEPEVMAGLRGAAFLTIGVFALVIVLGIVVLARAKRV